jgi:hypothetical protein
VDVIGQDDEGVEFVVAFGSVMLEGFDEEFGVTLDLKEAAAVVGSAGDEERKCRGGMLCWGSPFGDCNGAYLRG